MVSLIACEKADMYTRHPKTNLDALWKILDENYCFFEYKEVDWDEIYLKYERLIKDDMSQYELFYLLGDMIKELKDGHTSLYSFFDIARYRDWYEDYPPNFNAEVHNLYLGKNCLIAGGLKYCRMSNNQIGYIYYESFTSPVGEHNLDEVLIYFKDCKGLIIDVRENVGGSLTYSDRITSRFLEEKTLTGYIIHKTGKGHNDFSQPYPIEITPSNHERWLRPVVVLTNRQTYSAANDFASNMKILPNVTLMGDQTGGGGGLPYNSELPNGWQVRFSASPILNVDKEYTEHGVQPDIKVELKESDIEKRKDTLIEEAILLLLSKS
ncbi:MAG: S41 family peptidase [Tannerella sp.]|nr:S41 family peptidase [Tannerella sp.]